MMNRLHPVLPWRVRELIRRARMRTRAHRIPARWVRRPPALAGRKVCVFVMLTQDGDLLPHSLDHALAWHAVGYAVVAVVVVPATNVPVDVAPLDFAAAVMVRSNRGYDFGGWAAAIRALGAKVPTYDMLVVTNDSVLGPANTFPAMVEHAEQADADLVGLVDSTEIALHLQSFTLFFKAGALRSAVFRRFWYAVVSGDRDLVITRYEVPMQAQFKATGLRTLALYPLLDSDTINRTLDRWTDLLDEGFPYLKVRLLRENPLGMDLTNWRDAAINAGFDLQRLERQIAALKAQDDREWAI